MSNRAEHIAAHIAELMKNMHNATMVEVGWDDTKVYPGTGQFIAQVAALNEYGGPIYHPPGEQTIYRKLDEKTGVFLRNAQFVKQRFSNYVTSHASKGYWQMIPPRPFFRTMIAANVGKWPVMSAEALRKSKYDASKALAKMGEIIKGELQQSIRDLKSPANAPSTIRKKGFDDPLIDSKLMFQSVDFDVK